MCGLYVQWAADKAVVRPSICSPAGVAIMSEGDRFDPCRTNVHPSLIKLSTRSALALCHGDAG